MFNGQSPPWFINRPRNLLTGCFEEKCTVLFSTSHACAALPISSKILFLVLLYRKSSSSIELYEPLVWSEEKYINFCLSLRIMQPFVCLLCSIMRIMTKYIKDQFHVFLTGVHTGSKNKLVLSYKLVGLASFSHLQ